ncbi:acyl-CoA dehydrogenase [Novosphingobium endophyticum]|uniref:Acyl-CoA dehydrogenase n=1 Tax=Novosphingobium endophyticum TaxID=1955250 RepID=A0A916TV35_9SPHN|nr:acyl-CoA dehydrogenase family protein [Novosphingobium endophyticum]GGC13628.1 acyl-CoA dehydrogenase [Novosphingobium endophyticum]
MNFELSEDEELLKALTERFVADHYDHDSRRIYLGESNGFSSKNWHLLGELGLIAAPFPEEVGGLGLDATGIATIFEALGRGLVVEPLAENVVMAGRLFALTAPAALRDAWLEALITGRKRVALAHAETGARDGLVWIETQARAVGEAYRLSGSKPYCIAGGGADGYVVSARLSGNPGEAEGIGLYFIDADAGGLSSRKWHMADGSVAAALTFENVSATRLDGGLDALAETGQIAALARSAEALGIMERIFQETLDYLRTRDQFDAPLGSFQAIQHRMVAQYAVIERSRALLNLALVSWGTADFARNVQGARAFIADASVTLGHEMIQFHGGMGVTDELAIGGGHKRLLVLSRWPEPPLASLDRYAGLLN